MSLHLWWLYVTAVFLISATPGPNMLHVMTQSIAHGPRKALVTMAGLMSAVLLCLIASALGLGALLKASPRLFDILRYAGVAYLIWLGIKAWRAPVGNADGGDAAPAPKSPYSGALVEDMKAIRLAAIQTALALPKAELPRLPEPACGRPFTAVSNHRHCTCRWYASPTCPTECSRCRHRSPVAPPRLFWPAPSWAWC